MSVEAQQGPLFFPIQGQICALRQLEEAGPADLVFAGPDRNVAYVTTVGIPVGHVTRAEGTSYKGKIP